MSWASGGLIWGSARRLSLDVVVRVLQHVQEGLFVQLMPCEERKDEGSLAHETCAWST